MMACPRLKVVRTVALAALFVLPAMQTLQPSAALAAPARLHPDQVNGCPVLWTCADVGSPPAAGSQSVSNGVWTMSGGGDPASGNFHYAYQTYGSGASTATVTAHVTFPSGASGSAGVMLRDGAGASGNFYLLTVNTSGTVSLQSNNIGTVDYDASASVGTPVSVYLQIVRAGFTFTAFTSSTGAAGSWSPIGGVTASTIGIDMSNMTAGLVAGNGGSSVANTATFDGVSVQAGGTPVTGCAAGWQCQDVVGTGNPSPAGSQHSTVDGASWALNGAGYGLIYNSGSGGNDGFHFASQPFASSGTIQAEVTYNRGQYSGSEQETGLMFRQDTGAYSQYYGVFLRAGSGVVAQSRGCGYGSSGCSLGFPNTCQATVNGTPISPPVYLRLTWAGGSTFYAYYSTDGTNWTYIPCPTYTGAGSFFHPLTNPALGGMAVSGTNAMGVGTFEHLQISGGLNASAAELGSPSENCTCQTTRKPVNTADGSFFHTFNDIGLPGRGVPLRLTRTYRSINAAQNGPFGYGWTDNYNMALTTDSSTGTMTVHEETGTAVPFYLNGSTYQPPPRVFATLTQNGDGTFTFTRKNRVQYVFSAPSSGGQLLKEVDPNGYTTVLSYNASHQLITVTDPGNQTLTFAYWPTGQIHTVTDSGNRSVSFAYDASGNLQDAYDVGRADTGVGDTHFGYDTNHLLLTMKDPDGNLVTNVYDGLGRVKQQTDTVASGDRVTHFAYAQNSDGTTQTTITDPNGVITLDQYQAARLIKQTLASGTAQQAIWQYQYDPATLETTSVTDPNNHTWTYSWDGYGNLLSTVGPATTNPTTSHETTSYVYTPANSLFYTKVVVTDPSSVATTEQFDSNGNLLSVSRPLTQSSQTATTTLTYGDSAHPGDVTQVTDANGHATTLQYDSNGNLLLMSDALGNATVYGYNALGQQIDVVTPKGTVSGGSPTTYATWTSWDNAGDPISVSDPLAHQTVYHYDANGNVVRVVDAKGNQTSYTYDAEGEVTGVTRPDGSSEGYAYDANGNLLSEAILSSGGTSLRTLTYQYDPLNRVSVSIDPEGRQTQGSYDAAGNLTRLQNALGKVTTYGYDELNQLTSITYNDPVAGSYPGTPDVTFAYFANGQRQTMTDGTGTSSYTYDSLNRLTRAINGAHQETDYGYDLGGNLTQLTYPAIGTGSAVNVHRTYDAANRLTDVTDWNNNDTHFTYDLNSNLVKESYPASTNGTQATLSYDVADQLKGIAAARSTGASPFRWTFGYGRDPLGQVSATTDRVEGMRHSYSYDVLNRLTKDTRSNRTSTQWSYDATGNIQTTANSATGVSNAYCYDGSNSQLISVRPTSCTTSGGSSFSYNANGDRTGTTNVAGGATVNSYGYNQNDQLISFSQGSTTASYAYDGTGLRTSKTVGSSTEGFVWDLAEGMPTILQDGSTRYVTGPSGLPIEQVDGSGNTQYYLQDQLGSTRGLLDSSGNIVGTYTFDPYGGLKGHGGTASTPFGYAGQYVDSESGLQYLRARYYDPSTQQFLTVDPMVGLTGQPYTYAANSPVNRLDPTGQIAWEVAFAVGGAIIGGGLDAFKQYEANCGNFNNFNWGEFASASVAGAVTGLAIGSGVGLALDISDTAAASGAGRTGITLYRAVGDAEARDIEATGTYRIAGNSVKGGKYFSPTKEQAQSFVNKGWATKITSSEFSQAAIDAAEKLQPVGEGPSYFIPEEFFPHGPVHFP